MYIHKTRDLQSKCGMVEEKGAQLYETVIKCIDFLFTRSISNRTTDFNATKGNGNYIVDLLVENMGR